MHSNSESASLLKEKEKFEAMFRYASMGILVANSNQEILMVNNFLLSQFGYTKEDELIGKKIEVLIPTRFRNIHTKHTTTFFKKPENRVMGAGRDLFGIKKDCSEFSVELSLSHYQTTEGKYAIAFITDISKRKEIEGVLNSQKAELAKINLRIEELNEDLEKKVELRTKQLQDTLGELEKSKIELTKALSKEKDLSDLKSRFVSMASHEFRTPLSTILSSASLVAKYTDTDQQPNRDKHIQRIKTSVTNLTDLLNEFLSIGRIEDGKIAANFSFFNIAELLEAISIEMQNLAKPGQTIVYKHSGNNEVYLDPSLLRNTILNLLSNAIKFSAENKIINLQSTIKNKKIIISIKDEGIGIDKEEQQHLFERFFRAKNATNIQGTGLGLHIVAKYVELMNGKISLISELEKGTEIQLIF